MKKRSCAILIFSRNSLQEAVAKPLAGSSCLSKQVALHNALTEHTQNIANQTGLPVFLANQTKQKGNNFQSKLAFQIETVFAKGYQNVIAIGNDSPELTEDTLLKASNALQHHDQVIGPATDGGLYLIGLKAKLYNRDAFLSLAWQTDGLCADFIQSAQEQQLSTFCLEELSDIDNELDLCLWLAQSSNYRHLQIQIEQIIDSCNIAEPSTISAFVTADYSNTLYQRGPPLSAAA